jgi:DnaK suppressor protein
MTRSTTFPVRIHQVPRAPDGLAAPELSLLRAMLEQQRSFRTDQLAELHAERAARLREVTSGMHPRAVDLEINDSLAAGARAALHDVLDALRRMEAGCYGTCAECLAPIELERLEILPQVALCMRCQRAAAEQPRQ